MAEFTLKDWYDKEQTFDKETIYVRGTDGELIPFSLGTGGSADVRYVTFMSYDGLIEYGKKAVAVGDDCADPIARGIFATPTRESDVQYNYTFYGWATSANGAADANALKAVSEDRTVYANFAAAVRYYTITYYDSDGTTVLKTESLPYGSTPAYIPEKDGYKFLGWTPTLAIVTKETSYMAQFEELKGLVFVSRVADAISIADPSGSAIAVMNSGTHVIVIDNANTYKDLPAYNMTSAEATFEPITTTLDDYRTYGELHYSDKKLFTRTNNGSTYYLTTDNFGGDTNRINATGRFVAIAASPSSDFLSYVVQSGSSYTVRINNGEISSIALSTYQVGHMRISKNDEYLVLVHGQYSSTKGIRIYKLADGSLAKTIAADTTCNNLSISADGKYFAVGWQAAPYVSVYSLETFELVCDLSSVITASSHAAFVGDMLVVATGSMVRAFTIANGSAEEYFEIPTYSGGEVKKINTSHNGNHIAFYASEYIEMWSKA